MPKLPDSTDLGSRQTPQPNASVASVQPMMGRAISNFGDQLSAASADMQKAAMIAAERQDQQDKIVAESALNDLQRRAQALKFDEQAGYSNVRGMNVVGPKFVEDYNTRFKSESDQIMGGLQNENQKRIFQQRYQSASLQFNADLLGHQAIETNRFNEQTENDRIDLARRQLFDSPTNPGAYESSRAQINWAIEQKGKRLGWSEETIKDTQGKYLEKIDQDAVDVMVERDAASTLKLLDRRLGVGQDASVTGVSAVDNLTTDNALALRRRAASYVAHALNKQEADAKAREKDAKDAFDDLQKFVMTGAIVSPQYERELMSKVAGTQYEVSTHEMVQMSYAGSAFGSQPVPQQENMLRQLQSLSTTSGIGSDPRREKEIQSLIQIHEAQKAAYKENPIAAAARFGRMEDIPEVQITSADQVPQLIATRLGVMSKVDTYAGKTASPLQPKEMAAFVKSLATMPPDLAGDMLSRTGQMMTTERIQAFADQMGKAGDSVTMLAMLSAGDKTTAGRTTAELILRGHKALQDKTVKRDDAALTGWRAEISALVDGSLGNAEDEQRIKDAAYYVRAASDLESANAPGFKAPATTAADAVAMVAGLPIERNGVKTLLPRGMKEDEFNDALRIYTPSVLQTMSQGGKFYSAGGREVTPDQLASKLDGMAVKRFGSAGYVPMHNGRPITLDAAGAKPLVLRVR